MPWKKRNPGVFTPQKWSLLSEKAIDDFFSKNDILKIKDVIENASTVGLYWSKFEM